MEEIWKAWDEIAVAGLQLQLVEETGNVRKYQGIGSLIVVIQLVRVDHDTFMLLAKHRIAEGPMCKAITVQLHPFEYSHTSMKSLIYRSIAPYICPPSHPFPSLVFVGDAPMLTIALFLRAPEVLALATVTKGLHALLTSSNQLWHDLVARDLPGVHRVRDKGWLQQYKLAHETCRAARRQNPSFWLSGYPPPPSLPLPFPAPHHPWLPLLGNNSGGDMTLDYWAFY